MSRNKLFVLGAMVLVVGALALVDVVRATTDTTVGSFMDLEIANNTLYKSAFTTLGAFVEYIGDSNTSFGSSGTGTFDSFVRLQKSPTESGYNTNGTLEFDTKSGIWTHAIKVSNIPVVMLDIIDGNPNTTPNNFVPAWELFSDLNEANNDKQVSLDKLQVWIADNANVTGYASNFNGQATKVYDFSGKININDVNQGSGRGDLRYSIPTSLAGGIPAGCEYGSSSCDKYFLLYTKFGNTGADVYDSEGGFEEWKVKQYPTLQIVKNTVSDNGIFNFVVTGPTPSTPSITTVNQTGATTSNIVDAGTYTITEGHTQGWEFQSASCSTNGGAPVAYTQGSNITVAGGNDPSHVVCTFVNKKLQPLQVSKTASTTYNKTWNWTIQKSATPTTHELFDGESASSGYTVTVTKTGSTDTNFSVTGQITIHNPNVSTSAAVTGVSDTLDDAISASVDCGATFPINVAPNSDLVCTYTASPSDESSTLNTAQVTTDGNVPGGNGTANVNWTNATVTEVNGSVSVSDTLKGDLGSTSDSTSYNYSENFDCSNVEYSGNHAQYTQDNTATITETNQSANASVTVDCYKPTVSKTAVPAQHDTYTWTIDKSVSPANWSLFNGDTGTSDYTVSVVKTLTSTVYSVSGTITVSNPAPMSLNVDSVSDSLSGFGSVAVDCPASVVPANGSLVCTYSTTLPDSSSRTNTATADFGGDVVSASGTANVDFSGVTPTVTGDSITVNDTNGSSWNFSSSDSKTYSRTFDCSDVDWNNGNSHFYDNTATIDGGDSASASVRVTCYKLDVTKTANTTFDRTYNWGITKTLNNSGDSELTLANGEHYAVDYTVTVTNTSYTDSNHQVSGTITVTNPNPISDANLTDVVDEISTGLGVVVDCGGSTVVPKSSSLECTYTKNLDDGVDRVNTATVTMQNNNYASDFKPTVSGTTDYSANADVKFVTPTNEYDKTVDVTDTYAGTLGTVSVGESPKVFHYSRDVIFEGDGACGDHTVDNTATFTTHDNGLTGNASVSILVHINCVNSCTLTQGYWKTHNDSFKGGAPTDDNWSQLPLGEKSGFFTTLTSAATSYPVVGPNSDSSTWFNVFWTAPKGNAYYNLAHQWEAARLNVLNGASTTSGVDSALAAAQDFFVQYSPTAFNNLSKKSTVRTQVLDWAGVLGSYNEGLIGPGHCDENVIAQ